MDHSWVERALVVGLGSIGKRHLTNLRRLLPNAQLASLPARGGVREDPTGCSDRTFEHLEDAVSFDPTLAVIASPATHRLAFVEPLARRGTHLLVEKPLAASSVDARSLTDICRTHGSFLMVGYVLRYLPALNVLREALSSGIAGPTEHVEIEVGQYLPAWRPGTDYRMSVSAKRELGGGVLRELSHELDYFMWLFGPVRSVRATTNTGSDLGIDVEDRADLEISTAGGVTASIHLDMNQQHPTRNCKVVGQVGVLSCDLTSGEVRFDGSDGPQILADASTSDAIYLDELSDFMGRARMGERPLTSGDDGVRVLELIEAIEESAGTGRPVAL